MHKPLRTLVNAAILSVIATSAAHAGGFSLYTESSAAMTGNFGAGAAAEGADASIGWYNPAGLVLIHDQQVVFGGVGVFPTAKISGTSTFASGPVDSYVQSFSDLNGAKNGFVPSMHYALPIGERATVGFSVVAPFGLSTEWDVNSPVRYQATFTEVLTSNFSPEIGGKLTDNFSIGAGLDLQYARVKFNRMIGLPTALAPLPANLLDSLSYNKGNSFGVGFHAGVLGMFNDNHTRVGLNYQSKMRHNFHGYSLLSGPLAVSGVPDPFDPNFAAKFRSNDLNSAPVEFPDVVTLSGYYDVNQNVALLGSVVYTGWSSIQTLQLNNVAAPLPTGGTALVNSLSPQNYRDTWRASVGANYHVNQQWMLRVGGGYDQTPTNNVDRDVRLPDASRWALSVGAHYQMKPTIGFDAGYTHLFPADNPSINRTDPLGSNTYNVTATGTAGADLLGAQVVWIIDPAPVVATK